MSASVASTPSRRRLRQNTAGAEEVASEGKKAHKVQRVHEEEEEEERDESEREMSDGSDGEEEVSMPAAKKARATAAKKAKPAPKPAETAAVPLAWKSRSYARKDLALPALNAYLDREIESFVSEREGQMVYRLARAQASGGVPRGSVVVGAHDLKYALGACIGKSDIVMSLQTVDIDEIEGYADRTVKVMDLCISSATISDVASSHTVLSVCLCIHAEQLRKQAGNTGSDDFLFRERIESARVQAIREQLGAIGTDRYAVALSFKDDHLMFELFPLHKAGLSTSFSVTRTISDRDGADGSQDTESTMVEFMQELAECSKVNGVPSECPETSSGHGRLLPRAPIVVSPQDVQDIKARMASFKTAKMDVELYVKPGDEYGVLLFVSKKEIGTVNHPILFRFGDSEMAFKASWDPDETDEAMRKSSTGIPDMCIRVNRDFLYEALKGMTGKVYFRFLSKNMKSEFSDREPGTDREAEALCLYSHATVKNEPNGFERVASSVVISGIATEDDEN